MNDPSPARKAALILAATLVVAGALFCVLGPAVALTVPVALPPTLIATLALGMWAVVWRRASRARNRAGQMRLLESVVVHADDAVVILEADARPGLGRRVLYVNDAFCRMTGYAAAEVVGGSLHRLGGPESDAESLARLRAALDAGTALRLELRNHRQDGSAYWADISLVPVRGAAGAVGHWVMIQRDATARKRVEDELRRSEELFRVIFESTAAGVSLTDAGGVFVSSNPAFAAMVGRTVEQVLGVTPTELTHPDDWAAQVPLVAEVRAGTRDRFNVTKRYVHPDGKVVWAELSFAAIRAADGRYEYGLGVAIDVTEPKHLEEQLRQSQKMEAVGRLAAWPTTSTTC